MPGRTPEYDLLEQVCEIRWCSLVVLHIENRCTSSIVQSPTRILFEAAGTSGGSLPAGGTPARETHAALPVKEFRAGCTIASRSAAVISLRSPEERSAIG